MNEIEFITNLSSLCRIASPLKVSPDIPKYIVQDGCIRLEGSGGIQLTQYLHLNEIGIVDQNENYIPLPINLPNGTNLFEYVENNYPGFLLIWTKSYGTPLVVKADVTYADNTSDTMYCCWFVSVATQVCRANKLVVRCRVFSDANRKTWTRFI